MLARIDTALLGGEVVAGVFIGVEYDAAALLQLLEDRDRVLLVLLQLLLLTHWVTAAVATHLHLLLVLDLAGLQVELSLERCLL